MNFYAVGTRLSKPKGWMQPDREFAPRPVLRACSLYADHAVAHGEN
jgi:hypothetical protein